MHNYKKLEIWNDAIEIATEIYALTMNFPKEETYGITAQMRKCAVSVPSNIAEGSGRNTNGEFNHFLGIAAGSSFELETQLIISEKLKFCTKADIEPILLTMDKNQKMIYNLKSTLQ